MVKRDVVVSGIVAAAAGVAMTLLPGVFSKLAFGVVMVAAIIFAWRATCLNQGEQFRELVRILTDGLGEVFGPMRADRPRRWEDVATGAEWPRGLPLPGNQSLTAWPGRYLNAVSPASRGLYELAQKVFPPLEVGAPAVIWQRTALTQETWEKFDAGLRDAVRLMAIWGDGSWGERGYNWFLPKYIGEQYWSVIKAIGYLQIALAVAWGNPRGPYNHGFIRFGNRLRDLRL